MTGAFSTIKTNVKNQVAHLQLNRPAQANAINREMWCELGEAMAWVNDTPDIRVAVISGKGKHFCAGIDLAMFAELVDDTMSCEGRKREALREEIVWLQQQISSIDACKKPVLAAIHGACVGGGVDLICAADMRYSTADAVFSIKEIDVGMVADVGTLQRLPRLIGDGMLRELTYTGRDFNGQEAAAIGLTNRCFGSTETMMQGVLEIANSIAGKSPLGIRGCKQVIRHAREHSIEEGLDYVATWNAATLVSDDVRIALKARQKGEPPVFAD